MKLHRIELIGFSLILALAACTSPGGDGPRRDPLTLQGASVDEVTKSLGPPQADDRLPTGERVLLYTWNNSYVAGGYTTTPDGQIYSGSNWNLPRSYQPESTVTLSCVVRFTIGTDNRVNRVERHGDGC